MLDEETERTDKWELYIGSVMRERAKKRLQEEGTCPDFQQFLSRPYA
jgi:hypothetical protein